MRMNYSGIVDGSRDGRLCEKSGVSYSVPMLSKTDEIVLAVLVRAFTVKHGLINYNDHRTHFWDRKSTSRTQEPTFTKPYRKSRGVRD